jgi:hypothetical protein
MPKKSLREKASGLFKKKNTNDKEKKLVAELRSAQLLNEEDD